MHSLRRVSSYMLCGCLLRRVRRIMPQHRLAQQEGIDLRQAVASRRMLNGRTRSNDNRDEKAWRQSARQSGQKLLVYAAEAAIAHDHDLVASASLSRDLGDDVLDSIQN